jgi:translation initiation factor IF-1
VKLLDEEAPADEEEEEAEPEAEGADVEAEPEAAASEEIAEGDTITFMLKGEETQAEVIEVVDEETLRIKTEDGTKYKLAKAKATKVVSEEPAAEPEVEAEPEAEPEAEADEETVELEEGSEVVFTLKGKEVKGEIVEVVDEDTVRVKAEDGKTYKLGTDKIQPAPKAKAAKKVTRKLPGKKK